MRRLLASLALGFLALPVATGVPASAHEDTTDHRINWDGGAPKDGDGLFGNDVVGANAHMVDGISRWRIEMRPAAGGASFVCEEVVPNNPRTQDLPFQCPWDTTRSGSPQNPGSISVNGKYLVEVTVWNVGGQVDLLGPPEPSGPHCLFQVVGDQDDPHQCGAAGARWREVYVVNPVLNPTGVGRSFDSGRRVARVIWSPNPEPDIEKYIIQEKVGDGSWTKIGEAPGGTTSFERPISDPGNYQYRVAAVRPEVAQSDFVASEPMEVTAPDLSAPAPSGGGEPGPEGPEPGVTVLEPPSTSTTVAGTTVSSGPRPFGGGGSSLFSRPSASSFRPSPSSAPKTTPTTADTGYSETLPYKAKAPEPLEQEGELAGGEEPRVIEKLIEIPRPRDARSLLIPMAGGLLLFVFAMQVTYLARHRPITVSTVEDDFGDWLGL